MRPHVLATPTEAPVSPGAGPCFAAATPLGTVRLAAGGPDPRHAVDAAIALGRCEALLDALDDWLGEPLDWRWIPTAAACAGGGRATACWRADPAATVRVELPWALLRALPAPAGALAAGLDWTEVPVVLALDRFEIDADELALLEPGGAVVVPASFEPGWRGRLRAVDEDAGAGVPVALPSPWAPRLTVAGDAAADAPGTACELRLSLPRALPGDRLAGWRDAPLDGAATDAAAASLWRLAPGAAPRCLALGRLAPWGPGRALLVDALCDADGVVAAGVPPGKD